MVAAKADSHEILIDDNDISNEYAVSTTTTTNPNEIIVVDICDDDATKSSRTDLIEIQIDYPNDLNEIDELDNLSSYGTWKGEMENYMKSQGLLGVVDGSEPKPGEGAYFRSNKYLTDWKIKDNKSREAIEMKLGEDFRKEYDLVKHNSAKEAWEKLSVTVSYNNLPESERRDELQTDTRNYDSWKVSMEFNLRSEDLWSVIDGSEEPPPCKCSFAGVNSSKEKKARQMLHKQCSTPLYYWVKHARSAKLAWDMLSTATILNKGIYNATAARTIDLNKALTGDINDHESWKDLDEIILVDISNYDSWIIYMENYLRSQNLWNVVHGIESSPRKDKKAHRAIKMALGPQLNYLVIPSFTIFDSSSGKLAWKQLRDAYAAHKSM
ncbi:hypothetical protein C5167_004002 [Papaver somniferum]|uniref:uncharacterized protein LOC113341710 n=1 Tax=Papaver somniferum TaxID=3469 RepID=UPI000E700417|nr:uncharacterized protein LOC113341710 [Papaver somniferum]RZC92396.1 hypothetical protein C5167_004002 [Papaver somniferum]